MRTIKLVVLALVATFTFTSCEEEGFELEPINDSCYVILKNIQQQVDGGWVHEYYIKSVETGEKAIVYSYTINQDEDLQYHMALVEGSTWCAFYDKSKFTEIFEQ